MPIEGGAGPCDPCVLPPASLHPLARASSAALSQERPSPSPIPTSPCASSSGLPPVGQRMRSPASSPRNSPPGLASNSTRSTRRVLGATRQRRWWRNRRVMATPCLPSAPALSSPEPLLQGGLRSRQGLRADHHDCRFTHCLLRPPERIGADQGGPVASPCGHGAQALAHLAGGCDHGRGRRARAGAYTLTGMVAPGGTPRAIVEDLNRQIVTILAM